MLTLCSPVRWICRVKKNSFKEISLYIFSTYCLCSGIKFDCLYPINIPLSLRSAIKLWILLTNRFSFPETIYHNNNIISYLLRIKMQSGCRNNCRNNFMFHSFSNFKKNLFSLCKRLTNFE